MSDTANVTASKAPLLSHLTELRTRLLRCLALFAVVFGISYYYSDWVYAFLTQPLAEAYGEESGRRMIYTGLHEAFFTYMKLSFFVALFVSIPFILNQVWKFLAPGLYAHEKKSLFPAFFATPVLFLAGSALAFHVIFPLAWKFFIGFETTGLDGGMPVELEARVGEYLSLVINLILAFGLSFELPVILLVLAKAGLVTANGLRAHRKHAIVLTFFVAALITPPDIISQIALGTPVLILYEFSIWLINFTNSDALKKERDAIASAKSM